MATAKRQSTSRRRRRSTSTVNEARYAFGNATRMRKLLARKWGATLIAEALLAFRRGMLKGNRENEARALRALKPALHQLASPMGTAREAFGAAFPPVRWEGARRAGLALLAPERAVERAYDALQRFFGAWADLLALLPDWPLEKAVDALAGHASPRDLRPVSALVSSLREWTERRSLELMPDDCAFIEALTLPVANDTYDRAVHRWRQALGVLDFDTRRFSVAPAEVQERVTEQVIGRLLAMPLEQAAQRLIKAGLGDRIVAAAKRNRSPRNRDRQR